MTCVLGALLLLLAGRASAVVDVSGPASGIAVVPFVADASAVGRARREREEPLPDIASLLALQLSALSSTRVVSPDTLRRDGRGTADPQARDIRRWARWNAVENVVVGHLAMAGGDPQRPLKVDVELRSGHSGAPRAEYRLEPDDASDLHESVARLAVLILADLGGQVETAAPALPDVSASGPGGTPPRLADEPASEPGDEGGLQLLPGVSRDDPISINSDELEVLPYGGGRRLVFSRNVEVKQGDITLNADRLEAIYPEGASQPDRLLASGRVRIAQGERRGRCEEATYERASHTIVCRGKAEVLQGCDQVRGEQIEFDLERERVRVTGAASVVIQSGASDTAERSDASGCVTPGTDGGGAR